MESDPRAQRLVDMVDRYQAQLLRLCYLILHDTMLAEDAVQETFLKAYRAMGRFRGDCQEKTWLMRIAINTCRDMRRSAWLRHTDRSVTPEMLPPASVPFEQEDEDLLMTVMALPVKLREAVLLYYFEDMRVKEVAAALGVTPSTVTNRLQRAAKALRTALERGNDRG